MALGAAAEAPAVPGAGRGGEFERRVAVLARVGRWAVEEAPNAAAPADARELGALAFLTDLTADLAAGLRLHATTTTKQHKTTPPPAPACAE
jgi:hypothetical protein